ncbi:MAG: HEAT repeat domain-containing protein [Acidimicrobiales bacterium]|nr:HEAT repeat domain-containing protein [Acidimicrobiales bacterium]
MSNESNIKKLRRRDVAESAYLGNKEIAIRAVSDLDPKVRASGLSSLFKQGAIDIETLIKSANDQDALVQVRALDLIGDLFLNGSDGPEALLSKSKTGANCLNSSPKDVFNSLLIAFLKVAFASDPLVVVAAFSAIGEIFSYEVNGQKEGLTRDLIEFLLADNSLVEAAIEICNTHKDPRCIEAAVASLGVFGSKGVSVGLDTVILVAQDGVPATRRRAILALSGFDDPKIEPVLEKALLDKDWQVRQCAEDILGAFNP